MLGDALDIIDLGCGTGLMGGLVRDRAKRLVGLDLSRKMLDEAEKKGIYDLLIPGDINDVLANCDDAYDAVVSADVFIYVGDLSETFALVNKRLRNGGLFAFSVEGCDGDGFQLNPSMRYSHSANYIRQLGQTSGFVVQTLTHDFMRREITAPEGKISGYYVVMRKS
jgi:predicted TPR repeat methyltransferase